MRKRAKADMVVYIGQYISERICKKRGLPTINIAGTNRIQRIAEAVTDAGTRCWVLSPGVSARLKSKGVVVHRAEIEKNKGVPVFYASALAIPFLTLAWAPFAIVTALLQLKQRYVLEGVIVYNFHFIDLLVALICRFVYRIPVIMDLEDVSIPRWSDWRRGSETSALQQLWLWPLMHVTLRVCHAVFAPTSRFRSVLPHGKKFEVLDGCMRVPALLSGEPETVCAPICAERPLALLFSGKIEFEHGVDVLAKAILSIDMMQNAHNYHFHICGGGSALEWLKRELSKVQQVNVFIHGFVSNCLFRQIFDQAEVCLVLQKPDGRHSFFKTPSKGYEALCAGKTLVVSNIGDFGMLPASVCRVVDPLNEESLAEAIKTLTREDVRRYGKHALAHARTRWDSAVVGRRIVGMMASAVDE